MKCRKCGEPAVLELRRHNAAFCAPDFLEFFRNQVREAIRKHRMFTRDETVLVAVSGGKDLLDIEMQIGKCGHVDLEELTSAFVAGEGCWEGIRFPCSLRIQPLDEGFHIVRVPRREHLPSDMEVVLCSHGGLLLAR